MVHPLLCRFIQNDAATSWSLIAHNTAVLDAMLPAIEKLTIVFSLCSQSGKNILKTMLFKVRQPGTLAPSIRRLSAMGTLQVTLLWYSLHVYVWEEEWAVLSRDVVASKGCSPLVLTARLRLGRKEWAVVSRDNVDGKSHFYELPSAESSDSHMTCELTVLDIFFGCLSMHD